MMELEHHGVDTYVGVGPEYPWGGLYGGQIVAQALRSCGRTVDEEFVPHSLHAYYIRPGDWREPIRFEVERLRNGRSFVTRQVVARQSTGAILTMIASFKVDEEAPDVQAAVMPTVPAPEEIESQAWTKVFDRRSLSRAEAPERLRTWMRLSTPLDPDDRLLHACGIAYMSDDLPVEVARELHPAAAGREALGEHPFIGVSLDHAMWFHRPARADEWHFEDFMAGGLTDGRGLTTANLFDSQGTHIATVAQEALIRLRRR